MLKRLPNLLTFFRIALVFFFPLIFFNVSTTGALIIFILAGLTDLLDGYMARKFNAITPLGTVLDPLADKLMLIVVLFCLYLSSRIPLSILALIFTLEIFLIISGSYLYVKKEKIAIPANIFGKIATFLFTCAIISIFLYPHSLLSKILIGTAIFFKLYAFSLYLLNYYRQHT